MKLFFRHLVVVALPLVFGLAAGYGFAGRQASCGSLVGPIFAAKCHGRLLEYQMRFQTAGTAIGTVVAAALGAWLEHRRRRAVQRANSGGGPS
ncbi:MAG TPA: hypothetical protein VIW28_15780 [Gemmatimonadales bacterium]|jgi:hypothetical protein